MIEPGLFYHRLKCVVSQLGEKNLIESAYHEKE